MGIISHPYPYFPYSYPYLPHFYLTSPPKPGNAPSPNPATTGPTPTAVGGLVDLGKFRTPSRRASVITETHASRLPSGILSSQDNGVSNSYSSFMSNFSFMYQGDPMPSGSVKPLTNPSRFLLQKCIVLNLSISVIVKFGSDLTDLLFLLRLTGNLTDRMSSGTFQE